MTTTSPDRQPPGTAAETTKHTEEMTMPDQCRQQDRSAGQAMEVGDLGAGHGEQPMELDRFGGAHGERPDATRGERPSGPTHGERRHQLGPEAAAMLAAARKRRGWSFRQAAASVGIAHGMIAMLEAGTRAPSRVTAEALITAYGLGEADAALLRREAVHGVGYERRQADRW
jgi:ribosome-binding protein aMBF1 (putative translation factor)